MFNFFRRKKIKSDRAARVAARHEAIKEQRQVNCRLMDTVRMKTAQINTMIDTQKFKLRKIAK